MALIYIVEDDKNIQEIEMFALKNIDYAVEGFECAGDFYKRLDAFFPGMSKKYRDKFGNAYWIPSDRNQELMDYFYTRCKRAKIMCSPDEIFAYISCISKNRGEQLSLFS